MNEDRLVTVCASCLQASCWQGEFYCIEYRTAGTVAIPISELRTMARESPHYWRKENDNSIEAARMAK